MTIGIPSRLPFQSAKYNLAEREVSMKAPDDSDFKVTGARTWASGKEREDFGRRSSWSGKVLVDYRLGAGWSSLVDWIVCLVSYSNALSRSNRLPCLVLECLVLVDDRLLSIPPLLPSQSAKYNLAESEVSKKAPDDSDLMFPPPKHGPQERSGKMLIECVDDHWYSSPTPFSIGQV